MVRPLLITLALAVPIQVLADPIVRVAADPAKSYVDLRVPHAMEELQRTNPAHYAKIQKVLAGIEEQPNRVEGDWLQVNFDAHDVSLQSMLVKTSNPPKQLLSFRLDEVRYTMYVVRRDMVAEFRPAN